MTRKLAPLLTVPYNIGNIKTKKRIKYIYYLLLQPQKHISCENFNRLAIVEIQTHRQLVFRFYLQQADQKQPLKNNTTKWDVKKHLKNCIFSIYYFTMLYSQKQLIFCHIMFSFNLLIKCLLELINDDSFNLFKFDNLCQQLLSIQKIIRKP